MVAKRATRQMTGLCESEPAISQEVAHLKIDQLIDLTYGSLKQYTEKFNNRSVYENIEIAMNYARGGSELIQTAIQLKIEFFGAGFKLKISSGRKNNNEKLNTRIADWLRKHDMRQICDDLLFDLLAADNCVLQWKVNPSTGNLDYITTLPPDTVIVYPGTTEHQLGIRITNDLRREVLASIAKGNAKQWSPKIVDAVKTGKPIVIFDEADGEFWILKSRGPKFAGLRQPSMRSIFADIQLRELLISGDWSTAYFTKNFITLVTMGESITHGPKAGTRDLYPTDKEIKAVQAQFKKVGTTLRMYGNHTMKIQYVYPDQKVLGNEKYEGVERRIDRWTRVPAVMLTGQGDGYSQSTLAKRSFEVQGERIREDIIDIFTEFFDHQSVRDSNDLNLPTNSVVKTTFNRQMLKDAKQILDEVKFLVPNGLIDVETTHEMMGLDYEEIADRKARDAKQKDLWRPVFEPNQGMLSGSEDPDAEGDNGRPTDGVKPKAQDGPRPSRNE